jgi:hypothetical protein
MLLLFNCVRFMILPLFLLLYCKYEQEYEFQILASSVTWVQVKWKRGLCVFFKQKELEYLQKQLYICSQLLFLAIEGKNSSKRIHVSDLLQKIESWTNILTNFSYLAIQSPISKSWASFLKMGSFISHLSHWHVDPASWKWCMRALCLSVVRTPVRTFVRVLCLRACCAMLVYACVCP